MRGTTKRLQGCAWTCGLLLAIACVSDVPSGTEGPNLHSGEGAPADYVLTAARWTSGQTSAVEVAGGTVKWSHEASGIGVATSNSQDFLERVMMRGAFTSGAIDEVVVWQPRTQSVPVDEAGITENDETFFPFQWNMRAINAPEAWDTGAGSGATVAVLDGGFYDLHPDLANLDTQCSVSFVSGEPYNSDLGTFWHGTYVAGLVGAADNGFGVIGVAPQARLLGVKVLHGGSGTFGQIINGILYASDPAAFGMGGCERADIINMSLGATLSRRIAGAGQLMAALAQAVSYAASKNVLVISAAGNAGLDFGRLFDLVILPAQSGSGLAISATGPTGISSGATNFRDIAPYSNYGEDLVSLAAPGGQSFTATGDILDAVLSTCRGSTTPPLFTFCFAWGTSGSSATAAGVAALIVGQNPGISVGALKARLFSSADDEGQTGKDEFYGHGFVNAFKAVSQ